MTPRIAIARLAAASAALSALVSLTTSCTNPAPSVAPGSTATTAAPAAEPAWTQEARSAAMSVPPRLLTVLQTEIARSGPEGAIAVCRDQAPELARSASQETGWTIRRVSLRNRNPRAVPDVWERAALEDFDRRAAAGVPPAQLERAELVTGEGGQRVQRYMRALPTLGLCLQCHGAPEQLSAAVKARLAEAYPQDRAVGYKAGDIRGAMTLQRPAR